MSELRTISYGGGVQSSALIVLAAQGVIDFKVALFANVGDDSEYPATITYVRDVMQPWAAKHGIEVHELHRVRKSGEIETIWGKVTDPNRTSQCIPVRLRNGMPGSRSCTHDFKVKVIGKWLKAHGATKKNPATVGIGISTDEIQRLGNKRASNIEIPVYPLIDLSLSREDCKRIIERAGLPVPPKSSCFFCPFHRPTVWARMRRDEPELFEKSADLEDMLNVKLLKRGKDPVYLTRLGGPLRDVIKEEQPSLDFGTGPGEDGCDTGYCWT